MKKKNLLVSAVAMLVVSALGLTAATYAWFTATREPSLAAIDMQVTTSQTLQVSDKGTLSTFGGTAAVGAADTDWVDTLSLERLGGTDTTGSLAHFYSPMKLADSTPGKAVLGDLEDFTAPTLTTADGTKYVNNVEFAKATVVDPDDYTTSGFVNSTSYIRFTVYFRAEARQMVFMDLDKSVFTAKTAVTNAGNDLAHAIRAGFFVHGAADANTVAADPIVVAPNDAVYTAGTQGGAGDQNYTAINKTPAGTAMPYNPAGQPVASIPAAGARIDYNDGIVATPHKLVYLFDLAAATAYTGSNAAAANAAARAVTIYIWIEGFDDNCQNAFLGSTISSAISFYGVEIAL